MEFKFFATSPSFHFFIVACIHSYHRSSIFYHNNTSWVLRLSFATMLQLEKTYVTNHSQVVKPMSFHPFNYKGHLVAKPNHLIDQCFFFFFLGLILKFHVINDLSMICKVHAISTYSFYLTKYYKRHLNGWMTCVKNL